MVDPVILPSSRTVIDRSTIAQHLLNEETGMVSILYKFRTYTGMILAWFELQCLRRSESPLLNMSVHFVDAFCNDAHRSFQSTTACN